MHYKVYKKAIKKLAENDLQNISDIQYKNIRFLVINKIYS